jgi:hypothetical protein
MTTRIRLHPTREAWWADMQRAMQIAREQGAVVELADEASGRVCRFVDPEKAKPLQLGGLSWDWLAHYDRLVLVGRVRGWLVEDCWMKGDGWSR